MQDFFNWQGVFGTIIGIIGTVISIFVLYKSRKIEKFLEKEKERLSEQVKFILTDGNSIYELPFIRRQEVTRGEIQGRLGTIMMKDKGVRYSIAYTNSLEFYKQLDRIIDGSHETDESRLSIECTVEEFGQFDFSPNKAVKIEMNQKERESLMV